MTENRTPYPVRVDATLDPRLSRWLWLVKWLLLIPHFVVLAFLWLAFVVLTVVAFVAILVTGRYPRTLFDFDVGVLRWSWRVHYYGYSALGTDRYPPFTLAEVPEYPAHLDVPYPEHLSRGLVLVKWWLLALPHYLVLAVFVGGGLWLSTRSNSGGSGWAAGGLVGLLVLIAAVVLLFTGRYPRSVYDFVLGMDRWVLRVAAYVGLMTDRYPPFRLDLGGTDPATAPAIPPPVPSGAQGRAVPGASATPVSGTTATAVPSDGVTGPGGPAAPGRGVGWTAGRVVTVVVGAVLLLTATGLLTAGGGLLWADRTQRDGAFVFTPTTRVSTSDYALTSGSIQFDTGGANWVADQVLGTAQLEVRSTDPGAAVFVGVGPTSDVLRYLDGVGYRELTSLGPDTGAGSTAIDHAGGRPSVAPTDVTFWAASASGPRTQRLTWRPADGNWTLVVMRPDAAAGVDVRARVGATAPALPWVGAGLLVIGAGLMIGGALLVAVAVRLAQQPPAGVAPPGVPTPRGPTPRGPTPMPSGDTTVITPGGRQ